MSLRLLVAAVLAAVSAVPKTATAAPVTYIEEFTLPDTPFPFGITGQAYYVGTDPAFCNASVGLCFEGRATVLFDLTNAFAANPNNQAVHTSRVVDHVNFNPDPGFTPTTEDTEAPSTDASGYAAGTPLASATLSFVVSGIDPEDDNVRVELFAADGGAVLHQNVFSGILANTSISIPLTGALLSSLQTDGQLGLLFVSFGNVTANRDYNLRSARLEATTVPEPALLMLLGAGLASATLRRRMR